MFGNRGWLLKFLIPLGLFAALSGYGAWRLPDQRPHPYQCLSQPDRFDGRLAWFAVGRIAEVHPDGFTLLQEATSVRVRCEKKPGTGRHVSFQADFHKPDIFDVRTGTVLEHPHWTSQRGGAFGISGAVVLAWIWFALKRFRPTLRGLEPRTDPAPAAPVAPKDQR